MNKKLISAAVLLGLSSAATAVSVNRDGLGSVLLFPYYTMNDNKDTNIQIVNTTNQFKAVKVRFNEGVNTWEVRDFNLFLSPEDVWTAVITRDENGNPVLKTTDTTCTAPALDTQLDANGDRMYDYVGFSNVNFDGTDSSHEDPMSQDALAALGLTPDGRMKEGHFEVIEMGDLATVVGEGAVPATAATVAATKATKHVGGVPGSKTGVPINCQLVRDLYLSGDWATGLQTGLKAPSGGLFGEASVIDVNDAREMGYSAVAVNDFFLQPANAQPGSAYPNLAGKYLSNASGVLNANTQSTVIHNNQVWNTTWSDPSQALAAVLMTESIVNTFSTEAVIGAATDWVVTFPNRHAFVNKDTASAGANDSYGQFGLWDQEDYRRPVNNPFLSGITNGALSASNTNRWNISLKGLDTYDREETKTSATLQFSPQRPGVSGNMKFELNVLQFSADRSVLGSLLDGTATTKHNSGWAVLRFNDYGMVGTDSADSSVQHVYKGLPAVGFATTRVVNGSDASTLRNYSALYDHKYVRNITSQ